ncbi:MAG TPA: hypothetical protein VLF89_03575 [Candidatus Saccharimonadales bacterium]|nr:hypothetical protein [Candidatus Saccharimonadales bacterium]
MFNNEEDFSFAKLKYLFFPLTTVKAVTIIFIAGVIVYLNSLFNGFVWDDKSFIILNIEVHSLNIFKLFGQNSFNTVFDYRPIPAFYFTVLYSLFGENYFFYHIFQLTLHLINTILIFLLLKHFFSRKLSLFLSMLFIIHPMQVESVSYIASSYNPLFFLFGIIALLLTLKENISLKRLLIIFSLSFLSLLTKETGVLFLVIILLSRIFFKRGRIFSFSLFSLITIVLYLLMRFSLGGSYYAKSQFVPIDKLNFFERLVNIPAVIFYYLKTFVFPDKLVIEQQWLVTKIDFGNFYFPLFIDSLFFIVLLYLGFYLYKMKSFFLPYIFFCSWFLLGIIFHSQIVPLDMTVADRWFYFPIVGLLGIIGVIVQLLLLLLPQKHLQKTCYIVAIIILVFLSIRTVIRNEDWANGITLYSHDLKFYDNYDIENNLGYEYANEHNYKEAIIHFEKSIALLPHEGNLYNIGLIYEQIGDKKKTIEYLTRAINAKNYNPIKHKHELDTYKSLAWQLLKNRSFPSAKKIIKEGLTDYPDMPALWEDLAICEYGLHNQNQALVAIKKAQKLSANEEVNMLYLAIQNKKAINLLQNQQ